MAKLRLYPPRGNGSTMAWLLLSCSDNGLRHLQNISGTKRPETPPQLEQARRLICNAPSARPLLKKKGSRIRSFWVFLSKT